MSETIKPNIEHADLPATVSLFPLDSVVLLPRRELPLNVFEPRYLALIDAALAGNRLIGIIQTIDDVTDPHPALQTVGSLGRITAFSEQSEGRYVICLTGVSRFRITSEVKADTLYRQVHVDYSDYKNDVGTAGNDQDINRAQLLEVFSAYLKSRQLDTDWDQVEKADNATLVDTLSMISPFGAREKQALLEAASLAERAEILVALTQMSLAQQTEGSNITLQ